MLDIVSVLLGVFSILQNLKNKQSLSDKVTDLIQALNNLDVCYRILRDAKSIHDTIDMFYSISLNPFTEFLSLADQPAAKIRDNYKKLKDQIKKLSLNSITFLSLAPHNQQQPPDFSVETHLNIGKVVHYYPLLKANLDVIKDNILTLDRENYNGNFGKDFERSICILENTFLEMLHNADKTILHSAPILDSIHNEVKVALKELL
jgi:hypothetical protein